MSRHACRVWLLRKLFSPLLPPVSLSANGGANFLVVSFKQDCSCKFLSCNVANWTAAVKDDKYRYGDSQVGENVIPLAFQSDSRDYLGLTYWRRE